jgi:subtilase family serine protease
LSTKVQNLGKADAKNVVVRFYNGTTPIGDSSPIPLGPGASQTVSISWYYGKLTSATISAVADPDQEISESDESNNKTNATIQLK